MIAESTRKSDQLDARVLAEFLVLDMIPTSADPRQWEHRVPVRQRDRIQRGLNRIKNRMRRMLANYNADTPRLFAVEGVTRISHQVHTTRPAGVCVSCCGSMTSQLAQEAVS